MLKSRVKHKKFQRLYEKKDVFTTELYISEKNWGCPIFQTPCAEEVQWSKILILHTPTLVSRPKIKVSSELITLAKY